MTQTNISQIIVTYCRGLLRAPWRFNIVYLSLRLSQSHDSLTRALHKRYSWKTVLNHIVQAHNLSEGYLIIDETEVMKMYSRIAHGLSWIFSHKENRHIFGYQIVMICWTNNRVTIPLGWKIYDPRNGKTKTTLAVELMQYCLYTLGIAPIAFLFDAFYASEHILKYLENHHQHYFSQVPKSRLFEGKGLKYHEKGRPYWTKTGYLKGHIQVQVVKNRRKYFITNHLGISRKEQLDTYRIRWNIEEVFRFVKSELGFEECQSTSQRVQNNHIGCCFLTYALLQDIAVKTQMTVYRIKQNATLDSSVADMLDVSVYLSSA